MNRGLVHVKCALSNTDLKDPEEENLRGPATHRYPAYRKEIPTKPTPKIGCTGPIPGTERQRNVLTPASANAKKKKKKIYQKTMVPKRGTNNLVPGYAKLNSTSLDCAALTYVFRGQYYDPSGA